VRKSLRFIYGIALISLGCVIFLSLISFEPHDIKFLTIPSNQKIHNLIGIVGSYLSFYLFFLLGKAIYFLPLYLILLGLKNLNLFSSLGTTERYFLQILSFIFLLVFLSLFLGIFYKVDTLVFQKAGLIGFLLSQFLTDYLGFWGTFILSLVVILITLWLLLGEFFLLLFEKVKKIFLSVVNLVKRRKTFKVIKKERGGIKEKKVKTSSLNFTLKKETSSVPSASLKKSKEFILSENQDFSLPSQRLLKSSSFTSLYKKEEIYKKAKELEKVLSQFGVPAKVVNVQKGPTVTLYELEPEAGVKIHKISALADDIALALKSDGVRVIAPIPLKGTVGVEVPNERKEIVYLKEVINSKQFINHKSLLALALGKDIKGEPVVTDLKEMPHLLIAGTTGSGKTVCINALICSILFKAKPDEVKFILIDPKKVELAHFQEIPHLLVPVISDVKRACRVLEWAVEEMEKRYEIFAQEGVRNIEVYNRKKMSLPYIVIIIDELADLMVVAKEKIEASIQRLAQLSRAVGIHLILATQRPSVDVITGVIKANFPARISFKVSSKVDSRTVLDRQGAERLLGKGDLLFLRPQDSQLVRIQGSFVDDEDIEKLVDFLKKQAKPEYKEEILHKKEDWQDSIGSDELLEEAIRIVLTTKQASASLLQRRLRIGYTRAARLLDLMEREGIVGPFCGSKAREILVNPEEYLKEKGLV